MQSFEFNEDQYRRTEATNGGHEMKKEIATISMTNEIMAQFGLHTKKGFGQNFITDANTVRKIAKEGKLKAVVSITIDDEFVIHDIKVIDGDKGLFIAMPSKKTGDGDYRDIAHPINSDTRGMLQRKILEAYNNASDEEV